MPWWESRMLVEQMEEDKPWITRAVLVEEREQEDEDESPSVGWDLRSLAAAGFSVRDVG